MKHSLSLLLILILATAHPVPAQMPDWFIILFGDEMEGYFSTSPSGSETYQDCTITWLINSHSATATFTGQDLIMTGWSYITLRWSDAPSPFPISFGVQNQTESNYFLRLRTWEEGYEDTLWTQNFNVDWGLSTPGGQVEVLFGLSQMYADHNVSFTVTWGDEVTPTNHVTFDAIKALYR